MNRFFTLVFLLLGFSFAQAQLSMQALAQAAAYSQSTDGSAVLVMQNGQIVFEDYHNGADSSTATHLHSATKGFWSLLAAHALETGLFQSYEEPVAQTITAWLDTARHPYKRLIRIKHLLNLSSGLSQDVDYIQGTDPLAPDIYAYTVDSLDLNSAPGNVFRYGPSHYYAFGVLLEKKLQQAGIALNPLGYLDSILFQPIGLEYASWVHDSVGNPHIPNGCYITPRNWIKFGQLVLQKGRWQGMQLVDSNLVEELFVATGPNPGHGQFLWLNNQEGFGSVPAFRAPQGSPGGFMYYDGYTEIIGALGAGKNRMYIIPSLDAVIIRQTLNGSDNFVDHTFLSYILSASTSIEAAQQSDKGLVFPNPATDKVYLHLGQNHDFAFAEIVNTSGKTLLKKSLKQTSSTLHMDVHGLHAGLYVLRLGGSGNTEAYKFLKK